MFCPDEQKHCFIYSLSQALTPLLKMSSDLTYNLHISPQFFWKQVTIKFKNALSHFFDVSRKLIIEIQAF